MSDFAEEMKTRTKNFGLRIIKVVASLEKNTISQTLGKQLLRCGTSVGANYRAACRARSPAEFRAKLGIVEEEADESIYWLELLVESELIPENQLQELLAEADEILSIVVRSITTSKRNS